MAEIPGLPHESESFKKKSFFGQVQYWEYVETITFWQGRCIARRNCSIFGRINRINYQEHVFSANKRNLIPKAVLAHYQGKWAETLVTWHPLWSGEVSSIAHISHHRHHRRWCTFFNPVPFFAQRTRNLGLFWSIGAVLMHIYALLGALIIGLNSGVVPKNWQISGIVWSSFLLWIILTINQCEFCKSWIDAKRGSHFLKCFLLNIMLLISMINSYQVALLLAFVAAPISIIFQYYSCHLQCTCILYPNISQKKVLIVRKDFWKVPITDTPHDTQNTLHLTWKFCDTYLKSSLECLRYLP